MASIDGFVLGSEHFVTTNQPVGDLGMKVQTFVYHQPDHLHTYAMVTETTLEALLPAGAQRPTNFVSFDAMSPKLPALLRNKLTMDFESMKTPP